ncbi:MAG: hypothetical protein RBU45_06145 [Myxococcota bacterium]|jgi:hypothetical protein|nr:hypothetical protein [Myxococcota bacterium]
MPLTAEEKEHLADRIVGLLRDPDPPRRLQELQQRLQAGEAQPDGHDEVVLALATALLEHLRG